ncbi:MAG: tetratricopeptide repeat protein [Gemmataceae bacterium]|nr:tetratricopeptide repeat protein [Gemmataceae bacterium]
MSPEVPLPQSSSTDTPPDAARLHLERGMALARQGEHPAAAAEFTRALELNPSLAPAYNNRGVTRFTLNALADALTDFGEALRLDARYAGAHFNRGHVYLKQRNYRAALADFTAAIELHRRYADAYFQRGIVRVALDDPAGALADFDNAIRLQPRNVEAYVQRGLLHFKQRDPRSAIVDFSAALAQKPDHGDAYFHRALAFNRLWNFGASVADFDHALALFDQKRQPPRQLCRLYTYRANGRYHLDDLNGAVADYRIAERLSPETYASTVVGTLQHDVKEDLASVLSNCAEHFARNPHDSITNLRRAIILIIAGRKAEAWLDLEQYFLHCGVSAIDLPRAKLLVDMAGDDADKRKAAELLSQARAREGPAPGGNPAQPAAPIELFQQALNRFLAAERLPEEEVQRVQAKQLQTLLHHAVRHVPFYRELYQRHGVQVETIKGADDLWRLPAFGKEDLLRGQERDYVDERQDLTKLVRRRTSGSLGHALSMFATLDEAITQQAALWAGWVGRGVQPGDRLLMLSAPHLEQRIPGFESEFIPVSMPIDEVLGRFTAFAPTVVVGSTEVIALLAEATRKGNLSARHSVRRVFPFGQTLSLQLDSMIRAGFDNAEVFDLYGSVEAVWMGVECERHHGLHVPSDRVIVQVCRRGEPERPAEPGELGEVIITALEHVTTPFIRYRIKDVAVLDPSPCACGRTSPRLRRLEGRVQDFLVSSHGDWVAPGVIQTDVAHAQEAILDHRIVQESPGQVSVSIVPSPAFDDAERRRITEVIHCHLGAVNVRVDVVAVIPADPGGKRRRVYRTFEL